MTRTIPSLEDYATSRAAFLASAERHEWNDMRPVSRRIIKIAVQTGGMPSIDDGAVIRVLLQVGIAGRDNLAGGSNEVFCLALRQKKVIRCDTGLPGIQALPGEDAFGTAAQPPASPPDFTPA